MNEDLSRYFDLLKRWNEKIRLVSSAESIEKFRDEHLRDALELAPFLSGAQTLIDIGTGAGIPGMLIKFLKPDIEVTLLDSTRKKISFCDEAIRHLGLAGIKAVCARAEDSSTQEALGKFDAVVSRATWDIDKYVTISIAYLAEGPGARIYALKGARWAEELSAAQNTLEKQRLMLDLNHAYLAGPLPRQILSFKRK